MSPAAISHDVDGPAARVELSNAFDILADVVGRGVTFGLAGARDDVHLLDAELDARRSVHEFAWPQFGRGRHAAHAALERLGVGLRPVVSHHGAPSAGRDVVVSISHSGDSAVAAAARTSSHPLLGIDLQCGPLAPTVAGVVANAEERWWLRVGGVVSGRRLTAMWSAKEAAFKAVGLGMTDEVGFLPPRNIRLVPCGSGFIARVPARWHVGDPQLRVHSVAVSHDSIMSLAIGTPGAASSRAVRPCSWSEGEPA